MHKQIFIKNLTRLEKILEDDGYTYQNIIELYNDALAITGEECGCIKFLDTVIRLIRSGMIEKN